ncbi:amino acid ABC transporter permease [Dongia sedimenti]|uniref:Amino acid ABC transporter permease n=1 Tax=Dongia sedimenti TaxID=3064282 RepID=A0ABU0YTT9_9PROT|nr:amino acid ABC transporter permease [Rhodospirillaceae bacterium R-7]
MWDFFTEFVPKYLPRLLKGVPVTLELTFCSMLVSIAIGVVCAIATQTKSRFAKWFVCVYVEICRDVPLIVILLFVYFSLPRYGVSLPAFWAAVLGLSVVIGAYLSEVFRAAIEAIDPGQHQAGMALGMSRFAVYWKIILPQAMSIAIPTVGGYFISVLKDCALVSFIGVEELLRQGKYVIAETFRSEETYFLIGMIYFILSFTAARTVRHVENWLRPAYLRKKSG